MPPGTSLGCGRGDSRQPWWLVVIRVKSNLLNKEPRTSSESVENVVSFRVASVLLEKCHNCLPVSLRLVEYACHLDKANAHCRISPIWRRLPEEKGNRSNGHQIVWVKVAALETALSYANVSGALSYK